MSLLPNSKSIYTDWHKMFPGSGRGKQYPWLLDKIVQNQTQYSTRNSKLSAKERQRRWKTLLDYGAGKGGTAEWLSSLIKNIDIDCYDPGNELYKHTPLREQYDVVYSCDVLEHIEREDIDSVIEHCQSLSRNNLHIIDMTQAKKHLPDGRNCHITLLDRHQWTELFESHAHTIEQVYQYAVPDPNFTQRERVCIWTQRTRKHTKR